jgi:hypothetical protein
MKLLHNDGSPIGITFRKHKQNANSYVLRITGKNEMGTSYSTDIGANPEYFAECYEKAIDKRLELLGLSDDANAFQTLASAYGAFLTRYGIEFQPVTYIEFKLKGN